MELLTDDVKPYLREAAVCLIPRVTDEQLDRIALELERLHPFVLVRRLTESTVVAEGIPVYARSAVAAEAFTWDVVASHVRRALRDPKDAGTRITSIDVRETTGALV